MIWDVHPGPRFFSILDQGVKKHQIPNPEHCLHLTKKRYQDQHQLKKFWNPQNCLDLYNIFVVR
jgi:hypothetical protein